MVARLKELLKKASEYASGVCLDCDEAQELCAEYLISEGVIVLPYKPMPLLDEGDRVLCPICETDLMGSYGGYDNEPTIVTCFECGTWIDSRKAITRD